MERERNMAGGPGAGGKLQLKPQPFVVRSVIAADGYKSTNEQWRHKHTKRPECDCCKCFIRWRKKHLAWANGGKRCLLHYSGKEGYSVQCTSKVFHCFNFYYYKK